MLQFFRKSVPFTNRTKAIASVITWQVRWYSMKCDTTSDSDEPRYTTAKPEVACFVSIEIAEDFKKSLENAFHLLKYSGKGIEVRIKKVST